MNSSKTCTHSLTSGYIETPIGLMLAIADAEYLYLLEFADHQELEAKTRKVQGKANAIINAGECRILHQITKELQEYFQGSLKEFKTPLYVYGSVFQKLVWQELINTPYATTKSYAAQALAIGRPSSVRAVANANGANHIAIVIPCHRIINTNGNLGGYGGGIDRKKWLLEHERKNTAKFIQSEIQERQSES